MSELFGDEFDDDAETCHTSGYYQVCHQCLDHIKENLALRHEVELLRKVYEVVKNSAEFWCSCDIKIEKVIKDYEKEYKNK